MKTALLVYAVLVSVMAAAIIFISIRLVLALRYQYNRRVYRVFSMLGMPLGRLAVMNLMQYVFIFIMALIVYIAASGVYSIIVREGFFSVNQYMAVAAAISAGALMIAYLLDMRKLAGECIV